MQAQTASSSVRQLDGVFAIEHADSMTETARLDVVDAANGYIQYPSANPDFEEENHMGFTPSPSDSPALSA